MNQTFKQSLPLSFSEEVANSVTHAIGAFAMLILLPISASYAYQTYDLKAAIGISIFVISLFLMFLSSTIYHSMAYGSVHKYILRIIDHSMIYIAIAGSYTPVALSLVSGWLGYIIIVLQWGITLLGFYTKFLPNVSMKIQFDALYRYGLARCVYLASHHSKTSLAFGLLMLFGGLSYTIGAVFYAKKTLLPHDLASLYFIGLCPPIYRYHFLYALRQIDAQTD